MNRLKPEQRSQIVQTYFETNGSVRQTYRALRPFYGRHNRPSEQVIRNTVNRFRTTNSVVDNQHTERRKTVRTEDVIAAVERSVEENPNQSIRHRAQQLELCPSTLWKILRNDIDRSDKKNNSDDDEKNDEDETEVNKSSPVGKKSTQKRKSAARSKTEEGKANGASPAKRCPVKKNAGKKTEIKRKSKREKTQSEGEGEDDVKDDEGRYDGNYPEYEVKDVINHKVEKGVSYYLIRWKGYEPNDDTWEEERTLSCQDLIDKYNKKKKVSKS